MGVDTVVDVELRSRVSRTYLTSRCIMGKGGFFCCFSDAALGADERPPAYSRAAQSGAYANKEHPYMVTDYGNDKFQVPMKDALCHSWGSMGCCLSTFFTCTFGTNWCDLRSLTLTLTLMEQTGVTRDP